MAASFLGLAVQLPRDASDALESNEIVMLVVEEQPDEVMVGGKLAWRDGGKPSDAKGGYSLGCQQLACHVGWPLLLKFTSEIATSIVTAGLPNQRRHS